MDMSGGRQIVVAIPAETLRDDALRYFREEEIPASIEWVAYLSPLNLRIFAVELADGLKQAMLSGDLTELVELLEDWEATAELDAAPEVLAEIQRRKEYRSLQSFTS
jgi:hypothetical protein